MSKRSIVIVVLVIVSILTFSYVFYSLSDLFFTSSLIASPSSSFGRKKVINSPSNLTVSASSTIEVKLSWSDNSTDESGFYVERSLLSNSGFSQIGKTSANINIYLDQTVSASQKYYYRVQAYNSYQKSSYSNIVDVTIPVSFIIPSSDCYLGLAGLENIPRTEYALPTNYQIFSSVSPWNSKITNPVYNSNSDAIITNLQNILTRKYLKTSYRNWSVPIHVINSNFCTNVTVTALSDPFWGGATSLSLPVPVEAWAEPSTDGHMILLDISQNRVIEFSKFDKVNLTASTVTIWDLTSVGYGTPFSGISGWKQGSNGAGTAYIAGIITLQEMKNGAINHALNIITPNNRKFTDIGQTAEILCSPVAARTDGKVLLGGVWSLGYSDNNFYEGSRIQLDPAVTEADFNSWGLSEHAKIIARALRDYGAFVIDNGPDFNLTFQNLDPTGSGERWINEGFADIDDIKYIPLNKLKVLNCTTVTKS